MHPSVGVAAYGAASGDSAGEGGGISHHNPCERCCDLHLWWYYRRNDFINLGISFQVYKLDYMRREYKFVHLYISSLVPRPSPAPVFDPVLIACSMQKRSSVFAHCKRSKTGVREGLGMSIH